MPDQRSAAVLDVMPEEEVLSQAVEPDEPFRILILGDFSGRGNRGLREPLAGRKPLEVDRDTFDEQMARLRPELQIGGLALHFHELDHFHPDHIHPLQGERTAAVEPPEQAAPTPLRPLPDPSSGSLLDQIMEADSEPAHEPLDVHGDLAAFINRAMKPHLVPRQDPRQKERVAQMQAGDAAAMREVLHHPDYQALEAGWRAVWMLVRELETGEDLKLYLFDATLDEFAADPAGLKDLLTGPKEPWAVVVGNYAFGRGAVESKLLRLFALMGQRAGAPFLAEGAISSGDDSPEWLALRAAPEASSVGLAMPRFLLRLPYGKQTSPIESFPFEEMPESEHARYLWGNPAFCCAYLMAQSFLKDGWGMRPGSVRRMDGMPLHVYRDDGEITSKPCAEVWMTEKQAELLIEQGLMPLASIKGQDAVLLVRFQSIAEPATALRGRWLT